MMSLSSFLLSWCFNLRISCLFGVPRYRISGTQPQASISRQNGGGAGTTVTWQIGNHGTTPIIWTIQRQTRMHITWRGSNWTSSRSRGKRHLGNATLRDRYVCLCGLIGCYVGLDMVGIVHFLYRHICLQVAKRSHIISKYITFP